MPDNYCLNLITDLGDSAVLGALVTALSAYLFSVRCRKEALLLIGAFVGTSLAIALVKVLLMGCGGLLHSYGLRSPSGHTALSLVVYGLLAALIGNRLKAEHRFIPTGVLLPLAVLIAVSRVVLGHHTPAEVLTGLTIGAVVLMMTVTYLRSGVLQPFNPTVFVTIMLAVAMALHGVRLPAEDLIQLLARHFRQAVHCQEYSR